MIRIIAILCAFVLWFWSVNAYVPDRPPLRLILNIVGFILLAAWIAILVGIPV